MHDALPDTKGRDMSPAAASGEGKTLRWGRNLRLKHVR